jgi:hypothetical protein
VDRIAGKRSIFTFNEQDSDKTNHKYGILHGQTCKRNNSDAGDSNENERIFVWMLWAVSFHLSTEQVKGTLSKRKHSKIVTKLPLFTLFRTNKT